MYLQIGIVLIIYFKMDLSYWLLGVVTFKNVTRRSYQKKSYEWNDVQCSISYLKPDGILFRRWQVVASVEEETPFGFKC